VVKIYPLYPHPALLLDGVWDRKQHRYIAISDLHLGFESELDAKGIIIDSTLLLHEMLDELFDLIKVHKIDGIILLGDIKSHIGPINKNEWDIIPQFFKSLSEYTNVYLIPGNHDSNIRFLASLNIHMISNRGMVLDDTLLIHGHTMPSNTRTSVRRIVMGHIHPIFMKDSSVINGQRVWMYLKVKKEAIFPHIEGMLDIVVVPTFNKFLYRINKRDYRRKSISPLINRALKDNAIQQGLIITLLGSIVGDTAMLQNII
jgi:putative SbcD/Mre11-related phosphoesterase